MKKQRNHSEKRNPKRILRRVVSLLLCVVLMAGMVMPHMTVRANVETPEFTYVLFKEGANGTPVQYEAEWSEDSKVYTVGLPVMWIGTYYEIQLLADNSPTSWSFMGYTLPEGMTYNTETGLISGTPTSGASGYSVVSVTNDAGTSTDRMWLTMIFLSEEKKTKITTASILPQAEVNKSYNITLDSAGYYCPGATTWSLVSGNLPEGLALTQVGFDDGKLSGTPTKKGTYHFTIQAANAAGVDSREFTLVVGDNSGILLSDIKRYDFPDQYTGYIDTGSSKEFTISNGTESTLENISITLGGTNASAFTVSPANIDSLASGESTPFHVSLANGALAAGTYTATVTVASDTYTQCEDVCVKVIESPADGKPIILSDGLSDGHAPGALIGSPYSFSLNAVGAGIKWSLVNGYELPEGLILNEDTGEISGTPAAGAKSKYIYLKATNPSGYKEKGFNLDVFEVPEITAKEDTTVYDDTLPDGFVGQNYGHGIMLSSGSNHAKLMLTNGTLPSFSESFNGEETWRYVSYYSSRPTENDIGGHTFTVMAVLMDYCGNVLTTVSKTYTMNIYDALTVTGSASITNPRVGQAITPVDLSGLVGGGKPPYSYALDTDEKLPDGLTLNASTGVISGTPTQMNADYANVSLCVTDSASNYRSILLNVAPVLKIVAIPAAVTGLEYTATEQTGVATDEGYTVTGGSATDVGDYTATVSLQNGAVWSDETYEEKEISWSIEKRTVTVIPDSLSKDYGETDPVLTYSTDLGTDALRNAFALTATGELAREAGEDAGTYLISQSTFAAGSNFDMTFSTTPVNFTINKIPDPAVVNATATVKCGNTVSLENNVTGNVGTVSYAVQTALTGCSVDASNGVFTAGDTAGTCVVAVTVAESTNYNQRIIPITVTVTEKDIANLDVIQTGTTYGQTLENPEYEVTGGVLNTKIRYSGTLRADGSQYDSEEKPFAAGNYTVSVTCETADTIYSGSAEFVIAPANIDTAEVVLGSGLTYDGTIQTQNLSEVNCNDENILSSCNITGNTATNAGTYTLTVTAKVASNYTGLVQKEFSVAKAMPTAGDFTISSVLTKTYNGSPFSITVPTTSKTGMGTVTLKYAGGSEAPRDAGNYPLTINVTEGDNYQSVDSLAIGTMVINKAQWKYSKSILVDVISGGRGTVSLSELIAPGGTLGKLDTADTNQILKGTPEITTSAESEQMK